MVDNTYLAFAQFMSGEPELPLYYQKKLDIVKNKLRAE